MIPPRKEIELIKTKKEGRKEKEEEFDIKRLLSKNRRLITGGIISVLFLANLIHYFVLIICFLILALYKKSERTDAKTKKSGIVEMITTYIKEQHKTNHPAIFWFKVAVVVWASLVVLAFLLIIISLMLH